MIYSENFSPLFLKMKEDIASIAASSSNRLATMEKSFILVNNYCAQVKPPDTFDTPEMEMEFFKKIRPGFEAELIYFGELYFILSTIPQRRRDTIRYLEKQFLQIRLYQKRYQLLYEYYLLGRSDYDGELFTQTDPSTPFFITQLLPLGDLHSVPAGKVFAKFRAYDELHGFLEKEISNLKNRTEKESHSVKWTATKAALVELAYALKASGAINNGNSSIRDIATHLERAFQQDLSQFYRTFQEIRIRKNSRTTFLDRLKEKLENWMDNTDLNSKGDS
ncbi:RteC domain-containing protein [Algoriphagus sp. C2-6-M1]|uniref:RteC domain-containing protein n=1 Tax=Algoriphagus persicinus TaxID=3108754 RepID=UPI002B3BF6D2|nr:RteC domain-containing protein [Algoriphagus sp. C2-6-M1]MEB2782180.1 RteC domain-containing protein [Algoriphagus sp. C2-6-M1]